MQKLVCVDCVNRYGQWAKLAVCVVMDNVDIATCGRANQAPTYVSSHKPES